MSLQSWQMYDDMLFCIRCIFVQHEGVALRTSGLSLASRPYTFLHHTYCYAHIIVANVIMVATQCCGNTQGLFQTPGLQLELSSPCQYSSCMECHYRGPFRLPGAAAAWLSHPSHGCNLACAAFQERSLVDGAAQQPFSSFSSSPSSTQTFKVCAMVNARHTSVCSVCTFSWVTSK